MNKINVNINLQLTSEQIEDLLMNRLGKVEANMHLPISYNGVENYKIELETTFIDVTQE